MDFDAGCGNALLIQIECRLFMDSMTQRLRSDSHRMSRFRHSTASAAGSSKNNALPWTAAARCSFPLSSLLLRMNAPNAAVSLRRDEALHLPRECKSSGRPSVHTATMLCGQYDSFLAKQRAPCKAHLGRARWPQWSGLKCHKALITSCQDQVVLQRSTNQQSMCQNPG